MPKFIYNGDHADMSAFGLNFRANGEDTPATANDPHIIGKLRGNSHFDEIEEAAPELAGMTREQLQRYASEHFDVDIPMGAKPEMIEAVSDLIRHHP